MAPGGFYTRRRAEPVARLDRSPKPLAEQPIAEHDDVLDLDGYQQGPHMSAAFQCRWGLPPEHDVVRTGPSPIGWLG